MQTTLIYRYQSCLCRIVMGDYLESTHFINIAFIGGCIFFSVFTLNKKSDTDKVKAIASTKTMLIPDWEKLLDALERFKRNPNLADYRIMASTVAFTELEYKDAYFVDKTLSLKLSPQKALPNFLLGSVLYIEDDCHIIIPEYIRPDIYNPTARIKVLPLLEQAASYGSLDMQRILALFYLNGDFVNKDTVSGAYWLQKSGINPQGFNAKCKYEDINREPKQRQQNWYTFVS